MATRATVASTACPSPPPPPAVPSAAGTCANGGAGAAGSSLLCPQTTVRDYNKYLVQTLEAGDSERKAILAQLQALGDALAPLGDVRAELQARTRELHDAQRVQTEQALALQEERERGARLIAENHTLMAEQDDQRAKIAALLQMRITEAEQHPRGASCPIMVQVPRTDKSGAERSGAANASATTEPARCGLGVHSTEPPVPTLSLRSVVEATARGAIPPAPVPEPSSVGGRGQQHASGASDAATTAAAHVSGGGKADPSSVLKDQPPGSALVAALSAEVKTLQQLLDEQRAAYERDRAKQLADTRRMEQDLHRDLKKHSATIDDLHRQLHHAVSELCVYRHDAQITERKLRGEVEILTARAAEAERLLAVERSRRAADVQSALESQHARTGHVVEHVRARLAETEERERQSIARREKAIAELEAALRRANDEAARERRIRVRCEQRLKAEQEGRRSDVGLLRQQLRALEKRIFFNTIHGEDAAVAMAVPSLGSVRPHAAPPADCDDEASDATSDYTATTDGAGGDAADSGDSSPQRQQQPRRRRVGTGAAASFPKYDPARVDAITEALAGVDPEACVIHGRAPAPSKSALRKATVVTRRVAAAEHEDVAEEDDGPAKRRAARILADLMGTRAFQQPQTARGSSRQL